MSSIDRLRETIPAWCTVKPQVTGTLEFTAYSKLPSGAPGRQYNLRVMETKSGLEVSEAAHAKILPSCCVERHINHDGTFCIFLGSTETLSDKNSAINWWKGLKQFLSDQEYAKNKKKWPAHRSMSHGRAAEIQLRMEKIALENNWTKEVLSGMFRSTGWLGQSNIRIRNDEMRSNQRSPCPRGCKNYHENGIRKKCASNCNKKHSAILLIDCPNKAAINELSVLEVKRRKLECYYINEIQRSGIKCCGTMKDCQLA